MDKFIVLIFEVHEKKTATFHQDKYILDTNSFCDKD